MGRPAAIVLYVVALVAVVVGVDVLFFRNRFWLRLMVNVGIVLVFVGVLLEISEACMSASAPTRGRVLSVKNALGYFLLKP